MTDQDPAAAFARLVGTHAYIWAPIGSGPLMMRDNRHDNAYLLVPSARRAALGLR